MNKPTHPNRPDGHVNEDPRAQSGDVAVVSASSPGPFQNPVFNGVIMLQFRNSPLQYHIILRSHGGPDQLPLVLAGLLWLFLIISSFTHRPGLVWKRHTVLLLGLDNSGHFTSSLSL